MPSFAECGICTVSQRLCEIGSSIPLGLSEIAGSRRVFGLNIADQKAHCPALVERKHQRVCRRDCPQGREIEQKSLDRQCVGVGHVGVRRVRHCWKELRPIATPTAMNRSQEFLIAIVADAGFLIRGGVRGIQSTERQPKSEADGIILAALARMAHQAGRRACKIGTSFDENSGCKQSWIPVGLSAEYCASGTLGPLAKAVGQPRSHHRVPTTTITAMATRLKKVSFFCHSRLTLQSPTELDRSEVFEGRRPSQYRSRSGVRLGSGHAGFSDPPGASLLLMTCTSIWGA